jgi:hypothetical protein
MRRSANFSAVEQKQHSTDPIPLQQHTQHDIHGEHVNIHISIPTTIRHNRTPAALADNVFVAE